MIARSPPVSLSASRPLPPPSLPLMPLEATLRLAPIRSIAQAGRSLAARATGPDGVQLQRRWPEPPAMEVQSAPRPPTTGKEDFDE